jgi:hypothetical protein
MRKITAVNLPGNWFGALAKFVPSPLILAKIFHDGLVHIGYFKDGQLHNWGLVICNGKITYVGGFKKGVAHGFGSKMLLAKHQYHGTFSQGKLSGGVRFSSRSGKEKTRYIYQDREPTEFARALIGKLPEGASLHFIRPIYQALYAQANKSTSSKVADLKEAVSLELARAINVEDLLENDQLCKNCLHLLQAQVPILIELILDEHYVLFRIVPESTNSFRFVLFNSGQLIHQWHRKNPQNPQKQELTFTIPGISLEDLLSKRGFAAFIKIIEAAAISSEPGYYLNHLYCWLASLSKQSMRVLSHCLPVICWQTSQKSNNCCLEGIMAYVKHRLVELDPLNGAQVYHDFRMQLFTSQIKHLHSVQKNYGEFYGPNEIPQIIRKLESKVAKRQKKIADMPTS